MDKKAHHLDWVRLIDPKGRPYFYNTRSAVSQWDPPPDYREPTPRTVKAVQAKGVKLPETGRPPSISNKVQPTSNNQQQQQQLRRSASDRTSPAVVTATTTTTTKAVAPGPSKLGLASTSASNTNTTTEKHERSGGGMLRAVQSLAVFSGVKRTPSPPAAVTTNNTSSSTNKESSSVFGKALNSVMGGSKAAVDDRRHWGRPDRLRTESGEDDILYAMQQQQQQFQNTGTTGRAPTQSIDQYRFRTSSSADLIQLLNMTRTAGQQKKSSSSSSYVSNNSNNMKNMPRVPSFLEMDLKSSKNNKAAPRAVSKLAPVTQQNQTEKPVVRRPRRNTTNSILIDTLMSKPDTKVQIRCVASLLHAQMVRFALARRKSGYKPSPAILARFDVFNEDYGKPPSERQKIAAAFEASNNSRVPNISATSPPGLPTNTNGVVVSSGGNNNNGGQVPGGQPQQQLRRIPSVHTAGTLERQLLTRNQSKQDMSMKRIDSKVDIFGQDAPPSVPDKDTIANFIGGIFGKAQMEGETIIMLLIYVERLLEATKGKLELTMRNWQPIVIACMVLASKVWDDLSMWNADFSLVSGGGFNVKRINELEIALLECMQYNVRVPASTYAKYYFQLRAMRERLGEAPEEVQELSLEKASKLETLSDRFQNALGVDWEGPAPKKAEDKEAKKKKKIGPGKHPEERIGIRKRSNTLNEGVSSETLERMHRIGPSFAVHVPTASLEQVVSGRHEMERDDF
jgi:hypothetical protein